MNWLVLHIVGGDAFFSGTVAVIAGLVAAMRGQRWMQRGGGLLILLGVILVTISSTPLPVAYYAILLVLLIGCLMTSRQSPWANRLRWCFLLVTLCGVAWELTYRQLPTVPPASDRSLTIIGDSITAGLGSQQETIRWPELLQQDHQLEVQDISRAGATTRKAVELVGANPIDGSVVVIEIGGNDLLGSTSPAQFTQSLDQLLNIVCRDDRLTLMLELPLPPFSHRYGLAQRRLAAKYGVQLIPKRILLDVLSDETNTTDGLHLSPMGHARMAEGIWSAIKSAYPAEASP